MVAPPHDPPKIWDGQRWRNDGKNIFVRPQIFGFFRLFGSGVQGANYVLGNSLPEQLFDDYREFRRSKRRAEWPRVPLTPPKIWDGQRWGNDGKNIFVRPQIFGFFRLFGSEVQGANYVSGNSLPEQLFDD